MMNTLLSSVAFVACAYACVGSENHASQVNLLSRSKTPSKELKTNY